MSVLMISYLVNFCVLTFLGYRFFQKYRNISGVFFFIFCVGTALWFIFYFLTYFSTSNHNLLVKFGQLSYALSIIALYSFLLFLCFFRKNKSKIVTPFFILYVVLGGSLVYMYTSTDYIIEGLYLNHDKNDWYEIEGILFPIHLGVSLLFVPLAILLSFYRLKRVSSIDRKRLQYILFGMILFAILAFIFLLILPALGVWTMERHIGFLFLPFIISVFYATRRYDFLNFKITFLRFFFHIYAFICALLITKIIVDQLFILPKDFQQYWGISSSSIFLNVTLGIISFTVVQVFIKNKMASYYGEQGISKRLEYMKNQIPFILSIDGLNIYLEKQFQEHFGINGVSMELGEEKKDDKGMIFSYFRGDVNRKVFINDEVFIEENKNKFQSYKKLPKLSSNIYLVFPIRGDNYKVVGLFYIGKKSFGDPFFTDELNDLYDFTTFINSHIKYISIYKQIHELSVNLDKKVDEKTMEYNNLLNKQKEFIAYIGHEIRNPITNTLFLSDSLKDAATSLKDEGNLKSMLIEDSSILCEELLKISKLVQHIFSTEKFDLSKVELYKEKVSIKDFLLNEIQSVSRKSGHINFDIAFGYDREIFIDTTQFRQVIHNLMNNAIKFTNQENPKIQVKLSQKNKRIYITIEDNGSGFSELDVGSIFDKYSTGSGNAVGLGMGLYLCKKIVELHGGEIGACESHKLGGACFYILL